jgi:hypothetical protein
MSTTVNRAARLPSVTVTWLLFSLAPVVWAFPGQAAEPGPYQQVSDLAIYLGVIPAAVVRGHPSAHAEASMHKDARSPGRQDYHLTIALFERESGKRVENAEVIGTVSGLGHIGTNQLRLEPMLIAGTVTYGGYVPMARNEQYTITLDISRPGAGPKLKAEFLYRPD